MKDPCSKCKIKKLCHELPDDLSCEDVMRLAGILPKEDKTAEEADNGKN